MENRRRRRTSTLVSTDTNDSNNDITSLVSDQNPSRLTFSSSTCQYIVDKRKFLGESARGRSMEVGVDALSRHLVAVHGWRLKCLERNNKSQKSSDSKLDRCRTALNLIHDEMKFLQNLKHPNLIPYLAICETLKPEHLEVSILTAYVRGCTLSSKLACSEKLPPSLIRSYTEQITTGLAYLHRKNRVHRCFKASSVIVRNDNTLKIGDYEIIERLDDLQAESMSGFPNKEVKLATFEDGVLSDIVGLGLIVLSLAQAQLIEEVPGDIHGLQLTPELTDFLLLCFPNASSRTTMMTSDLLDHDFITGAIGHPIVTGHDEGSNQQHTMNSNHVIDVCHNHHDGGGGKQIGNQAGAINRVVDSANANRSNESRADSEFEKLEMLGKGAFGDVRKVRNKLDGNEYALKRIELQSTVSFFNRKITREVKLLSTLNHDNVVRYYNSWIETLNYTVDADADTTTSSSCFTDERSSPKKVAGDKKGWKAVDPFLDNDLMFSPVLESTGRGGFSVSVEDVSRRNDLEDDSEDEFSQFITSVSNFDDVSSDDDVCFERDSNDGDDDDDDDSIVFGEPPENDDDDGEGNGSGSKMANKRNLAMRDLATRQQLLLSTVRIKRFMYIQMEYCEKSTLRSCIDNKLSEDPTRMWRLFREILEGLTYIHKKEIIHRDLKPQNIFLDRYDHVKIGDFGLAAAARSHQVSTANTADKENNDLHKVAKHTDDQNTVSTGLVGTTLYVAPELDQPSNSAKKTEKKLYGSKADIYSLGIIFFEMFYGNMATKMERVNVLLTLRKPQITFPDDVVMDTNEAKIARWCLQHDPSKRPLAHELLQSNLVPAPEIENSSVLKGMQEILQKPTTKDYRSVIGQYFDQNDAVDSSTVYDLDVRKKEFSLSECMARKRIFDQLTGLLELYGAVQVDTSLLLPRYDVTGGNNNDGHVALMDSGGAVVTLPYNLRVPFARYIKSKNVTSLRRFEFGKVYRARKVTRSRPRESWRCSFDIVTSQPTLVADAQVVAFVSDVIMRFPQLQRNDYEVDVNDIALIRHAARACGCHDDDADAVVSCLSLMDHFTKREFEERLNGKVSLSSRQLANLSELISTRGTMGEIGNCFKSIIHQALPRNIKDCLSNLEKVNANMKSLQISLPVVFDLSYVSRHYHHFDGFIFRVSAVTTKKKKKIRDMLAAGGRYDKLLTHFNHLHLVVASNQQQRHHVVGVSLSVDRILVAVRPAEGDSKEPPSSSTQTGHNAAVGCYGDGGGGGTSTVATTAMVSPLSRSPYESYVDVMVCAVGKGLLIRERFALVKLLRDSNIRTDLSYDDPNDATLTLPEIIAKAQMHNIPCVAILNHKKADEIVVRFAPDFNNTAKCHMISVVAAIKKHLVIDDMTSLSYRGVMSSVSAPNVGNGQTVHDSSTNNLTSMSGTNTQQHNNNNPGGGGMGQVMLDIFMREKLVPSKKKLVETATRTKLSSLPLISNLSPKTKICVIVVEMESIIMKQFAKSLKLSGTEEDFNESVREASPKVTSKYRNYSTYIAERVLEYKFRRNFPVLLLYSYLDANCFRFV